MAMSFCYIIWYLVQMYIILKFCLDYMSTVMLTVIVICDEAEIQFMYCTSIFPYAQLFIATMEYILYR